MNYTRPNDSNHKDRPEDWLSSALIFASALGTMLDDNIGVVVDIKGDMGISDIVPNDAKQLLVFSREGQISIDVFKDEGVEEGTLVKITEYNDK